MTAHNPDLRQISRAHNHFVHCCSAHDSTVWINVALILDLNCFRFHFEHSIALIKSAGQLTRVPSGSSSYAHSCSSSENDDLLRIFPIAQQERNYRWVWLKLSSQRFGLYKRWGPLAMNPADWALRCHSDSAPLRKRTYLVWLATRPPNNTIWFPPLIFGLNSSLLHPNSKYGSLARAPTG